MKRTAMKINAILHPSQDGGDWCTVPGFEGCVSEGDTVEEATAMIQDAANGWLSVANEPLNLEPGAKVVKIEVSEDFDYPPIPTRNNDPDRELKRETCAEILRVLHEEDECSLRKT